MIFFREDMEKEDQVVDGIGQEDSDLVYLLKRVALVQDLLRQGEEL